MDLVPRNPFQSPRFGQIATLMLLPAVSSPANLDVALLGIPYDGGTSYRPGTRFGPRAIREQSSLIRTWHPVLKVISSSGAVRTAVTSRGADLDRADDEATPRGSARACGGRAAVVIGGDHSSHCRFSVRSRGGRTVGSCTSTHTGPWDDIRQ